MRLTRSARRKDVVERAVAAYANWRSECFAVHHAYRAWRGASSRDEPLAFDAYAAALDREERAAVQYATLVQRANTLADTGLAHR